MRLHALCPLSDRKHLNSGYVNGCQAAIGARVTVETDNAVQVQDVGGGYGHYGAQNDLRLHFGLGSDCEADIEVLWPDQSFSTESYQLQSGKRYLIVQGETPVEE